MSAPTREQELTPLQLAERWEWAQYMLRLLRRNLIENRAAGRDEPFAIGFVGAACDEIDRRWGKEAALVVSVGVPKP